MEIIIKNMINPKEELYNFLNSSYYGKKIKESRKKCNLTIAEASKITNLILFFLLFF